MTLTFDTEQEALGAIDIAKRISLRIGRSTFGFTREATVIEIPEGLYDLMISEPDWGLKSAIGGLEKDEKISQAARQEFSKDQSRVLIDTITAKLQNMVEVAGKQTIQSILDQL